MIKNNKNPWDPMNISSSRRIDSEIQHEIFWIKDEQGRYGFYLQSTDKFKDVISDINLKGITLIKRNSLDFGELFLVLNKQADWELFLAVCEDILSICTNYKENKEMIEAVENRLRRWQVFLMKNNDPFMPIELQMGLFAELICLKKLIPSHGIKESIIAWTGPDRDKQDFNFSDIMIEVKSYKTSNGAKVAISSSHQLLSASKPLYIVSFGLTSSEQGLSIKDILIEFETLLIEESLTIHQLFENKIISYGYMPYMTDKMLAKFTIDSTRTFEVNLDFPKLLPHQVPAEIVKLNYVIDLELCKAYERPSHIIFKI